MIEAAYIHTAIDELLAGTIGATRTVTVGSMGKGHGSAIEALSLETTRYRISLGPLTNHQSTPVSAIANYRIVRLGVTINCITHLKSIIEETQRDTIIAAILARQDEVVQALGYPGNLAVTSDSHATGIISGMLVNISAGMVQEDWDSLIAAYNITGDALVKVSQAV